MSTSSVGANTAAVLGTLANAADDDVAKTAYLLKKAVAGEKDMINKLLPLPQGGVDIQA